MAAQIDATDAHLFRQVTAFGNGAHVTVPRGWLGKSVFVVPANNLIFLATEKAGNRKPPMQVAGNGLSAFMTNANGEKMVFHADWKSPQPTLWHGDIDWRPLKVMQSEGELVFVDAEEQDEVILSPDEQKWVNACLKMLGIDDVRSLPELEAGALPVMRLIKALIRGDKEKQIRLLEEALEKLKAK